MTADERKTTENASTDTKLHDRKTREK